MGRPDPCIAGDRFGRLFSDRETEIIHTRASRRGPFNQIFSLIFFLLFQTGCAAIFGWDIHAPGFLSESFFHLIQPAEERIALYLPDDLMSYVSDDRGGRFADPQTYHIGEAFVPMVVEAFNHGFDEFILMETEPTAAVMRQYGIPYLVAIRPAEFGNRVTLKGQGLGFRTEMLVFNSDLEIVAIFDADGSSDAEKIFAKKGGPQLNLNAAIENNIRASVASLQDWLHMKSGGAA